MREYIDAGVQLGWLIDIPGVEGSVEIRLYELEEEFWRLKQNTNVGANPEHEGRLTALENKFETINL